MSALPRARAWSSCMLTRVHEAASRLLKIPTGDGMALVF